MSSTRSLKIGVRALAALSAATTLLWYFTLWFCLSETHHAWLLSMPRLLVNLALGFILFGPFICLALALALTWAYFRTQNPNQVVFLLSLGISISPLFLLALKLWER
jgi:hypothetical protein